MVDKADLDLFEMVDDPEEGWASLVRRGLKAHTPALEQPKDPAKPPPKRRAAARRKAGV
jgi:hypothetical protein